MEVVVETRGQFGVGVGGCVDGGSLAVNIRDHGHARGSRRSELTII